MLAAAVVGSTMLLLMGGFMADMGDEYGFTSNSATLTQISKMNQATELINDAENTTKSTDINPISGLLQPFSGTWQAVMNLIQAPTVLINMFNELLGLPELELGSSGSYAVSLITQILLLLGIAGVIKVFTGRAP